MSFLWIMDSFETSGEIAAFLHFSLFFTVVIITFYYLREEFKRAKESWIQASERLKSEEEKHSWQVGDGDQQILLEEGDVVVHADLGKGLVVGIQPQKSKAILVNFEALNDTREMELKNLLYIGQRVRHGARGMGTIKEFDNEERAHVKFDNGEYHRYRFEAWKRKMVPQSASRHLFERQTFRSFLYDYILYRSDYTLSTFTFAKPLVLLLSTYTLIVVGAAAYSKASGKETSESLWVAWTMVADPGTHADETGTAVRMVALTLTLGGMLVFALMIGIIADGVSSLLDGLKQGNSSVIEVGHTLILGWSDKTLPLVREICLANESLGGGVIVILAERPKSDMERELMQDLSEELRGTLVICRGGTPTNQMDLRKVSAGAAKSVVVLADNKLEPDESDARVVRCVLSLHGIRRSKMGHVVVEMCDVDNRDLAHLADSKNVEVVVAHDLIGRLMIQCAREPGLAQILDELLGFEGDEFYIKNWEEHIPAGTTFGEVLFRFEDAVPLGIKPANRANAYEQILNSKWRKEGLIRRDWDGRVVVPDLTQDFALRSESEIPVIDHFEKKAEDEDQEKEDDDDTLPRQSRKVIVNPPNDYILQPGDEILVLAEDDDSYAPKPWSRLPKSAKAAFESMKEAHRPIVQTRSEKFLFCGWRRDMDDMILELDKLVGQGSEVTIMCMTQEKERLARFEAGGLDVNRLKNISIRHVVGNPIFKRDLDRLPSKLDSFQSILILADQALETNVSSADSRSLASLLLIRDMIAKRIKKRRKPAPFEKSQSFSDGERNQQFSERDLLLDTSGLTSPKHITSSNDVVITSPSATTPTGATTNTLTRQKQLQQDYFVKRPSAVGQALFFENAHNTGNTVLISEILDSRTKALVPVAHIGDHVMSNEIVAATLAMVSECRDISVILSELLQADGNDLHIRSALDYGTIGEKIDFWVLQARARARGEIAIGYKSMGDKGPTLNPREKCAKITLHPKGTIIVIAED